MDNKQDRQLYWEVKQFLNKTPEAPQAKAPSIKDAVNSILKENKPYKQNNLLHNTNLLNPTNSLINVQSKIEKANKPSCAAFTKNGNTNPFNLNESRFRIAGPNQLLLWLNESPAVLNPRSNTQAPWFRQSPNLFVSPETPEEARRLMDSLGSSRYERNRNLLNLPVDERKNIKNLLNRPNTASAAPASSGTTSINTSTPTVDAPTKPVSSNTSTAPKASSNIAGSKVANFGTNLVKGAASLGVGALADYSTQKVLDYAGVKNETVKGVIGAGVGGAATEGVALLTGAATTGAATALASGAAVGAVGYGAYKAGEAISNIELDKKGTTVSDVMGKAAYDKSGGLFRGVVNLSVGNNFGASSSDLNEKPKGVAGGNKELMAKNAREDMEEEERLQNLKKSIESKEASGDTQNTAQPAQTSPAQQSQPAQTSPAQQSQPAQTSPAQQSQPAQTSPAQQSQPAQTSPAQTSPAQQSTTPQRPLVRHAQQPISTSRYSSEVNTVSNSFPVGVGPNRPQVGNIIDRLRSGMSDQPLLMVPGLDGKVTNPGGYKEFLPKMKSDIQNQQSEMASNKKQEEPTLQGMMSSSNTSQGGSQQAQSNSPGILDTSIKPISSLGSLNLSGKMNTGTQQEFKYSSGRRLV